MLKEHITQLEIAFAQRSINKHALMLNLFCELKMHRLRNRTHVNSANLKIQRYIFGSMVSIIICLLTARLRVRAMMPAFVALYTGLNGLTFRPAKITTRNNLKLLGVSCKKGKMIQICCCIFSFGKTIYPTFIPKVYLIRTWQGVGFRGAIVNM